MDLVAEFVRIPTRTTEFSRIPLPQAWVGDVTVQLHPDGEQHAADPADWIADRRPEYRECQHARLQPRGVAARGGPDPARRRGAGRDRRSDPRAEAGCR